MGNSFDSSPTDEDFADQQSQPPANKPLDLSPVPSHTPGNPSASQQQKMALQRTPISIPANPLNPNTPPPPNLNSQQQAGWRINQRANQLEGGLDDLQSKMDARAKASPSDGQLAQVPPGFFKPGTPTPVVGSPYRDATPLGGAVNLHPTSNQNDYNTWAAQQNGSQIQSLHPANAGQQNYQQSEMSKQLGEMPEQAQWIDQQANLRGGRITALGTYDGGEWHGKTHGFARATLAKEYGQGQNQAVTDPAATAYAARQVSLNGGRTGRGIFQEGQWKGRSNDSVMEELKQQYRPGME